MRGGARRSEKETVSAEAESPPGLFPCAIPVDISLMSGVRRTRLSAKSNKPLIDTHSACLQGLPLAETETKIETGTKPQTEAEAASLAAAEAAMFPFCTFMSRF